MTDLLTPLSDEEYERLDGFLLERIDEDAETTDKDEGVLDVSELDGFLAAVLSSPQTCLPSSWMPAIWGGEDQSPAWADMEEVRQFQTAIMDFYNEVAGALSDGTYEPIFLEWELDGKKRTLASEWCEGYRRGMRLWTGMSKEDSEQINEDLQPVILFSTPELLDELPDFLHSAPV